MRIYSLLLVLLLGSVSCGLDLEPGFPGITFDNCSTFNGQFTSTDIRFTGTGAAPAVASLTQEGFNLAVNFDDRTFRTNFPRTDPQTAPSTRGGSVILEEEEMVLGSEPLFDRQEAGENRFFCEATPEGDIIITDDDTRFDINRDGVLDEADLTIRLRPVTTT